MKRQLLIAGFVSMIGNSVQASAQTPWNPFGEVSGSVTLTGRYCYPCPDSETISESFPFTLGQAGSVSLNTYVIANEPNAHGVLLTADWWQTQDIHIIPDTPQPLHEIDAYEWSFEISAQALDDVFPLTGLVDVTIDVTVTEFVEVLLIAETRSDTFSATIGDLVAEVSYDRNSVILQSGSLDGDGRYLKSTILPPGTHRLQISGSTWNLRGSVHDSDGSVLLRFSPVCGNGMADLNRDGVIDFGDIGLFVALFLAGC